MSSRSRYDYQIERLHLEADEVLRQFGEFNPSRQHERESKIQSFLRDHFPNVLSSSSSSSSSNAPRSNALRLGFDVAASGQGDLAVFYIDEAQGSELWLRALLTARTEDWNLLKTTLFFFLENLRSVQAAGDESGLGRQICWEAASRFGSRFRKVNFSSSKHDLGFALMNQLSVAEKRFPRSEQDIAQDYFSLRKIHTGTRWTFVEEPNTLNPASHCDIAWAGALATHAHTQSKSSVGAALFMEDGTVISSDDPHAAEKYLLWSDNPDLWRRWI